MSILNKIIKREVLLSFLLLNNTLPMFFDEASPTALFDDSSMLEYGEIEIANQSKIFHILSIKSIGTIEINSHVRAELLKRLNGCQYATGSDIIEKFLMMLFVELQNKVSQSNPFRVINFDLRRMHAIIMNLKFIDKKPVRFTMDEFLEGVMESYHTIKG